MIDSFYEADHESMAEAREILRSDPQAYLLQEEGLRCRIVKFQRFSTGAAKRTIETLKKEGKTFAVSEMAAVCDIVARIPHRVEGLESPLRLFSPRTEEITLVCDIDEGIKKTVQERHPEGRRLPGDPFRFRCEPGVTLRGTFDWEKNLLSVKKLRPCGCLKLLPLSETIFRQLEGTVPLKSPAERVRLAWMLNLLYLVADDHYANTPEESEDAPAWRELAPSVARLIREERGRSGASELVAPIRKEGVHNFQLVLSADLLKESFTSDRAASDFYWSLHHEGFRQPLILGETGFPSLARRELLVETKFKSIARQELCNTDSPLMELIDLALSKSRAYPDKTAFILTAREHDRIARIGLRAFAAAPGVSLNDIKLAVLHTAGNGPDGLGLGARQAIADLCNIPRKHVMPGKNPVRNATQVFEHTLNRLLQDPKIQVHSLLATHWKNLLGSDADRVRPVKFTPGTGTLHLLVKGSSARTELLFGKAKLLRKINEALGQELVRDIEFSVG